MYVELNVLKVREGRHTTSYILISSLHISAQLGSVSLSSATANTLPCISPAHNHKYSAMVLQHEAQKHQSAPRQVMIRFPRSSKHGTFMQALWSAGSCSAAPYRAKLKAGGKLYLDWIVGDSPSIPSIPLECGRVEAVRRQLKACKTQLAVCPGGRVVR